MIQFEICDMQRITCVSTDVIKLRLFPLSLKDKAKTWFDSLPKNTIATWDEMTNKFLTKYIPPAKSAKFRGDITTFTQFDTEFIYDA